MGAWRTADFSAWSWTPLFPRPWSLPCPQPLPAHPRNSRQWCPLLVPTPSCPALCPPVLTSPVAISGSRLAHAPPRALDPKPLSTHWARGAISPLGGPPPLHGRTFSVGVGEAVQPLGTEAWLVVPRAVGLLRVLELAVVCPRVGVVEAAVDGWQDERPSDGPEPAAEAPRRSRPGSPSVGLEGQGPSARSPCGAQPATHPGSAGARAATQPGGRGWAGAGYSRQNSGVLQSTHTPLPRQAWA